MPKKETETTDGLIDRAIKDGQFQGQVLAKLDDLKLNVNNLTSNYSTLEGRVRVLETAKAGFIGGLNVGHIVFTLITSIITGIIVGVIVWALTHH